MINSAMIFLFDTCPSRCGYCGHATSGKVMDSTQLNPYRDRSFIDKLLFFFESRTTSENKWLLIPMGGEPLLMPNFSYFVRRSHAIGNKVAIYSSLNVGSSNSALRFLLNDESDPIDYIMASFHPEADYFEERYLSTLKKLKKNGHKVIFRFIAHPKRLHRMEALAKKCEEIDICFSPYAYCSSNYPLAYSKEERDLIHQYTTNICQVIQMENGIKVDNLKCAAGANLFYINARDGRIFPCPNVFSRTIGNVYDNVLEDKQANQGCYDFKTRCFCDLNFQQDYVLGLEDSHNFCKEKSGFVQSHDASVLKEKILSKGFLFHHRAHRGTLGEDSNDESLILKEKDVAQAYNENKDFYWNNFRKKFHREYRCRLTSVDDC